MGIVIIILAVAALSECSALFLPDGKTKKLLSFVYAAAAVFSIACGIKNAAAGWVSSSLFNQKIFETENYEYYDENLKEKYSEYYVLRAKNALEKEGIGLIDAEVYYGGNGGNIFPEKFIVKLNDLVIISGNEHINISLKAQAALEKLFSAEKIEVVIKNE